MRPWQLSTGVVKAWRAHREGLRHMAACAEEASLVTAGGGLIDGRECEVVRFWRLADTGAGEPHDVIVCDVTAQETVLVCGRAESCRVVPCCVALCRVACSLSLGKRLDGRTSIASVRVTYPVTSSPCAPAL